MSKRIGAAKQLIDIDGKYVLQWVVDAALESDLQKIYLILGCYADRILTTLPQLKTTEKITIIRNSEYKNGMSSSVKCGILATKNHYENVLFLLGDQPFISAQMINTLLGEQIRSQKPICLPTFKNKKGHPVLFNKIFYDQLLQVEGDQGGRSVLRNNGEHIHKVEIDDPDILLDIDTMKDLNELKMKLRMKISPEL